MVTITTSQAGPQLQLAAIHLPTLKRPLLPVLALLLVLCRRKPAKACLLSINDRPKPGKTMF